MPTESLSPLAVFIHLPLFSLPVTQIDGRSRAFYVAKELVDSERLWAFTLPNFAVCTLTPHVITHKPEFCLFVALYLHSYSFQLYLSCSHANSSSCMQRKWQPITQVSCNLLNAIALPLLCYTPNHSSFLIIHNNESNFMSLIGR